MALLNLLQLLQSDDQTTYTDKVNYNFDQILSMDGGPIGPTGFQGIQGVPGSQGIQGFQGIPGMDGSRWYVSPSTSTPTVPTPKIGDLWLQTDTLFIFEFLGSPAIWTNLGFTLQAPGVFTSTTGSNIVFSNPTGFRSLVLSPINYGGADSPPVGPPDYRLKIIGTTGSPMLRFGIEDAGIESASVDQPSIGLQKILGSPINWKWIFNHNSGDLNINLSGNSLALIRASNQSVVPTGGVAASVAVNEMDLGSGAQVRFQNSPSERLLSFAASGGGTEFFHIGRHSALATTTGRLFSIKDNGQVSFGDAFNNIAGATDFHIDSLNGTLPMTQPLFSSPPTNVNWMRLRGQVGSGNYDTLQINHNRLVQDTGPTSNALRSSAIRIQHYENTAPKHFISFNGGGDFLTSIIRPQLRLGYTNSYYLAGDVNGRIGIGTNTFIRNHNDDSSLTNPKQFFSKLTVEGNDSSSGGLTVEGPNINLPTQNSFSGITLVPQNFTNSHVGIAAVGLGSPNELHTYASVHFKDDGGSDLPGMSIHLGSGVYNNPSNVYTNWGNAPRQTIWKHGDIFFWSKNTTQTSGDGTNQQYLSFEVGGKNFNPGAGNFLYGNNQAHISSYDTAAGNSWKNIIFNAGKDTTAFGGGFVGIGRDNGFGEDIIGTNVANQLIPDQWYVAKNNTTVINVGLISPSPVPIPQGIPFQASGFFKPAASTLAVGSTVALANPVTKFHINDAVTFGTRDLNSIAASPGFAPSIGSKSFTVGQKHTASGSRSMILGGFGHTVSGADSVIMGYRGPGFEVNMSNTNTVLLATNTHVSMRAPSTLTPLTLYGNGDTSILPGPNPYTNASSPILNVASLVSPPPFFLAGNLGNVARVLTLEGKNNSSPTGIGAPGLTLEGIPVAMEFWIKNNALTPVEKQIGMIFGTYQNVGGNDRGKLSFAININGNTPSGGLFEVANFNSGGLSFSPIPGGATSKINVEVAQGDDVAGFSLQVSGGMGSQTGTASIGGNLNLDAGAGGLPFGGNNGAINIGNSLINPSAINIGNQSSNTTPIVHSRAVTNTVEGTHVKLVSTDILLDAGGTTGTITERGNVRAMNISPSVQVQHGPYIGAGGGYFTSSLPFGAEPYDRIAVLILGGSIASGIMDVRIDVNNVTVGRIVATSVASYGSVTVAVPALATFSFLLQPTSFAGSISIFLSSVRFGQL